jgi:hypothetical protein
LTLDRVLLARELQGVEHAEPAPDVLLSVDGCPECLAWAAATRKLGLRVEVDPLSLSPEELWRAATERNIPRIVWHLGPGWLLVRDRFGEEKVQVEDTEEVVRWRRMTGG